MDAGKRRSAYAGAAFGIARRDPPAASLVDHLRHGFWCFQEGKRVQELAAPEEISIDFAELCLIAHSGPALFDRFDLFGGKQDGLGVAFKRDYCFLETEAVLQVRADRKTHRPFGLYGGSPGQPSENYLNPDGENRDLPGKFTMTIKHGDVFRHVLAGAGGWGDPLERDADAVLRDVRNELLSPGKAAADYGVIVDRARWTVDAAATEKRRDEIRRARGWRGVPKVQRHDPVALSQAAE